MELILGALSVASGFLFASALSGATTILYGAGGAAAVTAVIASAIYTARNKSALQSSEAARSALKDERDASAAKSERLEEHLREEIAARKVAEARTDLTHLERMIVSQHQDTVAVLNAMKDTLSLLAAKSN